MRLPLHAAAPTTEEVAPALASSSIQLPENLMARLRRLRVLVVGNNATDREMLGGTLARAETRVILVANAAEALQRLANEPFDLLLSDIEMPEMNGHELMRRIRDHEAETSGHTHLPAIALTSHARRTDRVRALSAGFDEHITKPVDPTELALVIVGLVERYQSQGGQGIRESGT